MNALKLHVVLHIVLLAVYRVWFVFGQVLMNFIGTEISGESALHTVISNFLEFILFALVSILNRINSKKIQNL